MTVHDKGSCNPCLQTLVYFWLTALCKLWKFQVIFCRHSGIHRKVHYLITVKFTMRWFEHCKWFVALFTLCLTGDQRLFLSVERRRQIILGSVELAKCLVADTKFLAIMRSKRALSESDYQLIDSETVNYRRNLKLINVLLRGTDHTFESFTSAVNQTRQQQEVNRILSGINYILIFPSTSFKKTFCRISTCMLWCVLAST